jgi:hypothetical protein
MAYVYGHYKADTGELFYIGKGKGKRAWRSWGRSTYWKRVANKHGWTVKILEDNLTEEEAYAKEMLLIEETGIDNLVNTRQGGYGYTSEIANKQWQDPTLRSKISERMSAAAKKRWQNPEERRKNVERNKLRWQDPELKRRVSEANKKHWQKRKEQTPLDKPNTTH